MEDQSFIDSMREFYISHVVPIGQDSIQVFQSFTYGEMMIVICLILLILTVWLKWFWEVLR